MFDEYIKYCWKYYYRYKVLLCFCELDEYLIEVWLGFLYIDILLFFYVDGIFINEIKIYCIFYCISFYLNIKKNIKIIKCVFICSVINVY